MKIRIIQTMLVAATLSFVLAPAAIAADLTDVGFIDQAAVGSLPVFVAANRQLAGIKSQLDQQYNAALRGAHTDADRQRIALQFQQEFSDKQREIVGPIFSRAQMAIASVAAQKSLSIVVDKRIVVFGGQDVTSDVISALRGTQAIVPPTATPAPSSVGFVDQSVLDSLPKVQQANDEMSRFQQDQRKIDAAKMAAARTDADRQAVLADYNKALADQRDVLLKPLVDQTQKATADVAKAKNLILVIDRGDVIYGGTDITKDVQDAFGK
ncbi:MAG: OmpH family outer membrane protein [Vulcanimicrobiaceae bacterium]